MQKFQDFLNQLEHETGIRIRRPDTIWKHPCPDCHGIGETDSFDLTACPTCIGQGRCPGCQSQPFIFIGNDCPHCGWRKGTLVDAVISGFYRIAKAESEEKERIDSYWDAALPEILDFWANQTFLIQNRHYITPDALAWAYQKAKTLPLNDVSDMNDGALFLRHYLRRAVLNIGSNPDYIAAVDASTAKIQAPFPYDGKIPIVDPLNEFEWVKSDFLYLPVTSRRLIVQIRLSLLEHMKQNLYTLLYGATLIEKISKNPVKKETYGALIGRDDSFAWLQDLSKKITKRLVKKSLDWEDIAGNALEDWLTDLFALKAKPKHIQIAKLGITQTAIERNILDALRKETKQPEHLSLDAMEDAQDNEDSLPAFKISLPSVTQKEPIRPLGRLQVEQLDTLLGKTGRKIFACIRKHPEWINQQGDLRSGAKKRIAKAVGCDPSTVGDYFGTHNRAGKFQFFRKEIAEIL